MKVSKSTVLVVLAAFLAAPAWVAQAADDISALVNADFEQSFAGGGPVPGWAGFELIGDEVGPVYYTGGECSCLGADPNHRLKIEIGGGTEREWIFVKEVNWGSATQITTLRIHAGSHSWGGTGNAGLGVDLDGGTPSASSWTDCGANTTEYTGPVGTDTCSYLTLSGLSKPGGATTFNIVIRAYRPDGESWNAHFDNLYVSAVDPNPPPAPNTSSFTHQEGVWSNNDDIVVDFATYNADDYSYVWDNIATTDPDETADTAITSATRTDAGNYDAVGDWYFHVKAHNSYGWSAADHFGPLKIDDDVPLISNILQGGSECSVTADVTDTGGSPFGVSQILILGGDELLANGGFEDGNLGGWSVDGATPQARTTGDIYHPLSGPTYEGTWMCYKDACCNNLWDFTLYQEIPVVPLRSYYAALRTTLGCQPAGPILSVTLEWVNGPWGGTSVPIASESVNDAFVEWVPLSGVFMPTNTTATLAVHVNISAGATYAAVYLDAISLKVYGGVPDSYAGGVATWNGLYANDGDTFSVMATDGAGNLGSLESGPFSACDPGVMTEVVRPIWHSLR